MCQGKKAQTELDIIIERIGGKSMNDNDIFVENLYIAYYELLLANARRRTSDWALAEDMVQSTMDAAFENIEKVKAAPNVKGWLIKTLKFKLNRELSKVYRKHEVMTEEEYITELLKEAPSGDQSLTLGGLDEILPASCPQHFRDILYLRHVEKLQYNEIGKTLGITLGAAHQRLLAAHQWLRNYFDRHGMPY